MSVESAIGCVTKSRCRDADARRCGAGSDAALPAPAQPGATATAQRPSRAIRSKPGAGRVDQVFSTVTRGGEESTRPVLGSKLKPAR